MKHVILLMVLLLSVSDQTALAQPADDRSREESGNWIISETKSPVDYTPQISATILSTLFEGNPKMSFSMHCRRGRTEAMLEIADFARYPLGSSFEIEYLVVSQEAIQPSWSSIRTNASTARSASPSAPSTPSFPRKKSPATSST